MFEKKLTNACDKLLLFKLFFKKKKSIIFILPFPYVGRKNNTKRPCVIASLNKQDLKYEAATVTSISRVQLKSSYSDTKGVLI